MSAVLSNKATTEQIIKLGEAKGSYSFNKTFWLGFMGGIYIALSALGNMIAGFYIGGGLGRFIGSSIFPAGLMLTVLIGGSLFTGDALETLALSMKKMTLKKFILNLACVWAGNFCGALFIAIVSYFGGSFSDGLFADYVVHIASHKLHLTWIEALFSGFLCNMLVAIGVWFALATDDMAGKILAIWFPVMLFVFGGFQHVVANMYYLNIGLILDKSIFDMNAYLISFLMVTLGNFLSGGLFLPLVYKKLFIK